MKNKKGFTLIEFIIYFSITFFVMSAITLTMINVLEARIKIYSIETVNHNARIMMERITYEVRNSEKINQTNENYLELEVSSSINNPVIFELQNGDLTIKRGEKDAETLNTQEILVTSLVFSEVAPERTVQVDMNVSFNNLSDREEYDFQRFFSVTENVRKRD